MGKRLTVQLLAVGGLCFALAVVVSAQEKADTKEKAASTDKSAPAVEEGYESLFNGKDLTGWKIGDAKQSKVEVKDGEIIMQGPRSHIYTEKEYKNFDFKAEVKSMPHANSGIYFHTKYQPENFPTGSGYECQVNVSHSDPVKTGSLYNVLKLYETPAKEGEWYTQEIRVRGKHIDVYVAGKHVVDYQEPEGASSGPRLSPTGGCFALQAHDPKSVTYYRNIRVKALPEDAGRRGRRNN